MEKLIGSLAGLPLRALAETEQNFLIPSREQALIWGDLVPQLILSATIQRWWNVTPAQLHLGGPAHGLRREPCWPKAALNPSAAASGSLEALAEITPRRRASKRSQCCWPDGQVKAAARKRYAVGAVRHRARYARVE